ncbi:VTT domain-containing protein [Candidatus Parcubacteria bacterium]|nr:VTT domain-containing protein [Candidatus Parcubacteria bacterium]
MFEFIQNLIVQAGAIGALGFFIGAFCEEVLAPLPLPLLLAGVAFFYGKTITVGLIVKALIVVVLPITGGATLGSLVIYCLAYFGGKQAILKWSKWFGFSWDDVEKLRENLSHRKSDEVILFISRCLPFTPTTLLTVLAGIVRMNVVTYTLLTFSGIFVRVILLFSGAMVFGNSIFK